jgi:molybdenum cofactor biosynthesis protein B
MTQSLACAVLTISDSRTAANDTSGDYLAEQLAAAGHRCVQRALVPDNRYDVRKIISDWIANPQVQVILSNGGTGFGGRHGTPEAVLPLLDQQIDGFGELFRQLSYAEIGSSTIQSRALGGIANDTLIFCVPGSTNACRLAWERILREQFDHSHKPCNFATGFSC